MATFEESFLYPLVLLLVGAGVSGVLVSYLTNMWQDRRKQRELDVENHRKELEIKIEIVSRMSEAVSYIFTKEYMNTDLKKETLTDEEKKAIWENVEKFYNNIFVIRSKLQSYYRDTNLGERWDKYWIVLDAVLDASVNYFISQAPHAKKELEHDVELIKNYLSDDISINLDELTTAYNTEVWREVVYQIRIRGDEITKELLKLPIKDF